MPTPSTSTPNSIATTSNNYEITTRQSRSIAGKHNNIQQLSWKRGVPNPAEHLDWGVVFLLLLFFFGQAKRKVRKLGKEPTAEVMHSGNIRQQSATVMKTQQHTTTILEAWPPQSYGAFVLGCQLFIACFVFSKVFMSAARFFCYFSFCPAELREKEKKEARWRNQQQQVMFLATSSNNWQQNTTKCSF